MERISILSGGRVHTFAPFDPFREIAYKAGFSGAKWSALEALKHWVTRSGCIGVKIYPPMGFAPYGNCEIDVESWSGLKWICDLKNVPDGKGGHATIAERLDDVLGEMYRWCLSVDLPVMAHTDLSNGPSDFFNKLSAAKHWEALRACFGSLRVNFGHLGGFENTRAGDWNGSSVSASPSVNARDLVGLMSDDSSAPGGRFFADSAYTEKILSDTGQSPLLELYKKALSWKGSGQARAVLPDRLMYGSDWSLVMLETSMEKYFNDFVSMYARLDASLGIPNDPRGTLTNRFFGENAVDYLGLRDGSTRKRLTDFYADRGMTFGGDGMPGWMCKLL
jgi:predicted TIM-barrel fold metal-dependent hydrolase